MIYTALLVKNGVLPPEAESPAIRGFFLGKKRPTKFFAPEFLSIGILFVWLDHSTI